MNLQVCETANTRFCSSPSSDIDAFAAPSVIPIHDPPWSCHHLLLYHHRRNAVQDRQTLQEHHQHLQRRLRQEKGEAEKTEAAARGQRRRFRQEEGQAEKRSNISKPTPLPIII